MSIVRKILFGGFALAAHGAAAQWSPQWNGVWRPGEGDSSLRVLDVRVAPDGTSFVGGRFNRSNQAHAFLLRFESDGGLGWMHDAGVVVEAGGIVRLSSGRIALFGEPWADERVFVGVYDQAGGEALWERRSALGRSLDFERYDQDLVVETPGGDLLVRVGDQVSGDYVVLRYAADGTERPPWRWQAGPQVWTGGDIAALAGGGAVVTGVGRGLGGTMRRRASMPRVSCGSTTSRRATAVPPSGRPTSRPMRTAASFSPVRRRTT